MEIPENFEQNGVLLHVNPFDFSSVKKVKIDSLGGGIDLAVKAFKFPQYIPLRRRLRPNRGLMGARHCKKIAMILRNMGILTPEPLASFEFQKPIGAYQGFYACRFLETNFNHKPFLGIDFTNEIMYREFLGEFAHTIFRLHKCGIFHYDLTHSNILVNKVGDGFNIAFIDLNACRKRIYVKEKHILGSLVKISSSAHVMNFIGLEYAKHMGLDPVKFTYKLDFAHGNHWQN
ncbi:MAG: hypothetical protein OXC62_11570 [Aestuariivita sp.]|nr:hypothetical protein [Aestuariivita sp.]